MRPTPSPHQAAFSLKPFETLARASLALGTLAGFSLGLLLLLPVAFRLPLDLPWLPLAQVHGQVQTLGFAGLFIFAVGTVIFPRVLAAPDWDARRAELGGLLLAAGVALRAATQPLEPSAVRSVSLLLSGLLELAGGYGGLFGPLTGLGGVLGTLGFLLFAASLWPALGHLPSQGEG